MFANCIDFVIGKRAANNVPKLRLKPQQLHGSVSELCRRTPGQPRPPHLPVLCQPFQLHATKPFWQADARGVLHVSRDALGRMWLLCSD